MTGSFTVSNPTCPIQLISLLAQSTPYFRLDQTQDMQFVVTRHNNPSVTDPLDFTVFAQAAGLQMGDFTYYGMTFVPSVEPVITQEIVEEDVEVIINQEELVRSSRSQGDIDWLLTGLIIAVAFCTMCSIFLYCCRDKSQ